MNIVITGGAGFIGSHLARRLLKEGHQLTVVDNFNPQVHSRDDLGGDLDGEVRLIRGDVRDRDLMDSALKGQDVVVHLAAETGTGQSMYEIEKYVDVNIKGTSVLLDLLANGRHSVGKVVVASSRAIYGEGKYLCPVDGVVYPRARASADMDRGDFEPKCPCCGASLAVAATDEESKLHPASVYGITKQNQEQMVLTVCGTLGIPAVALRYQNVYGPGQSLCNPYTGILSIFSTRIKNGNDIDVFEDGKESRDFVYIDDVVDATVRGIESGCAGSAVFNVGSGVATDVLTVARTLVRQYGAQTEINVTGNYRLGDIRHNYADTSRIAEGLGYRPKVSFSEGIEKFVAWVNRQEVEADRSAQSLEEMRRKGLFK